MRSITIVFLIPAIISFSYAAKIDSSGNLSITGFLDIYYGYDFNNPSNHERPFFTYNHKRHNEFNLNLGILKASYNNGKRRANIGLMAGNYAQYNLAHEPVLLRSIWEANVGINISKKLSIDAGVFPSHLGFESAISTDNLTLTRSLVAENSPYYLAGFKINYTLNNYWNIAAIISNGWQNMIESNGNSNKAIGTQIIFKPNESILFNSSTMISNEKPDTAKQWRYFHDFYSIITLSKKLKTILAFDYGIEESATSSVFNSWYGIATILQYKISDCFSTSGRYERYIDRNEVIITTNSVNGFQTDGFSLNIDYMITQNTYLRIEGKYYLSKGPVFLTKNSLMIKDNTLVIGSLGCKF